MRALGILRPGLYTEFGTRWIQHSDLARGAILENKSYLVSTSKKTKNVQFVREKRKSDILAKNKNLLKTTLLGEEEFLGGLRD